MEGGKVQKQWKWSDQFLPEVKRLVKQHLAEVRTAPLDRDWHDGTDLELSTNGYKDVGVRIRKASCTFRDLTIRSGVISGQKTELDKLLEGKVDAIFYGWQEGHSSLLADWMIIDCHKLRTSGLLFGRQDFDVGDGSRMLAIPRAELEQAGVLVARYATPAPTYSIGEGNGKPEMAGRNT